MATNEQWHNMVTASIGGSENYGRGIHPNPWFEKEPEYLRRAQGAFARDIITSKIRMLFEPRFITCPATCETMEVMVTMAGCRNLLELGMHTGFGSLHLLRAIVGKEGAKLTSVDARPAHDREFFAQPEIAAHFQFVEGWTPDALSKLSGQIFDFVFVDSDHSVEHSQKELAALLPITRKGTVFCFHDVPEWQTPSHRDEPPVRQWVKGLVKQGQFDGLILPSPEQLDCREEYGEGYPPQCNPGLAVLIRK